MQPQLDEEPPERVERRVQVLVHRRPDDDHHMARLPDHADVVGHLERPAEHLGQHRCGPLFEERQAPRAHRRDCLIVPVVNGDRKPRPRKRQRQGQADMTAPAHDAHVETER